MHAESQQRKSGLEDLPAAENPAGSFLRPGFPRVTGFNRQTVIILASIVGIVVLSAIIFAFQPSKKNANPEDLVIKQQQKAKSVTPDEISKGPSTYGTLGKKAAAQQVKQENFPQTPLRTSMPGSGGMNALRPLSAYASPYGSMPQSYISPEIKEYDEARKSAIAFAASSDFKQGAQAAGPGASVYNATFGRDGLENQYFGQPSQDMTNRKAAFVEKDRGADFYLHSGLQEMTSPYTVLAGTVIPGVMLTGINSQLPGQLIGQVRENVYDSVTGNYLLIPQGSRVIGVYDNETTPGQKRVLVVWTRLILPNGQSLDLESMQGTDAGGYSGMSDKVNNHTHKLINGVLLSSLFAAAASLSAGDALDWAFGQRAAYGAADEVSRVGSKYAEKMMDIPPTIEIRPGMEFNIMVHKDMILEPYADAW